MDLCVFTKETWTTDQGSHFKNRVMIHLAKEYYIHHHFATTYTAWDDGTVERLNHEKLRSTEAFISELLLTPSDWTTLFSIIKVVLN